MENTSIYNAKINYSQSDFYVFAQPENFENSLQYIYESFPVMSYELPVVGAEYLPP